MPTRVTSSRFIGRTRELAELEAALADASSGRPSLAFIAGESGVGKTRLLKELERQALSAEARVISGDCVALGEDELPYAPIIAALRSLTRDGDPVLDELGPVTRAGLASLLPELARPSDELEEDSGHGAAGVAQARVFEALLTLLDRLGREEPVLFIIEDIHWADASTRAFLAFLTRSLRAERVLVTASYRPDELHRRHPLRPLLAELERGQRARRIELAPLTQAELAEQLEDILGAGPERGLVERLHARSEGNPLFTEELLAAGLDGRGELPPTLRDALMVRIEALSFEAQHVLRVLACAGRLNHALLAEAAALEPATLREVLREAVAGHILVADRDGFYAFRHALLREVVEDDILPGERSELHLALAHALERSDGTPPSALRAAGIAHHYLAAGDQPNALATAVRAATAADSVHAHGEAARLLERALDLWPRVTDPEALAGTDHVTLLVRAATNQDLDGDGVRAEALYAEALRQVDADADPHRAAGLLERLASERWSLGAAEAGMSTLEQGLALLPEDDISVERAGLLAQRAKFSMLAGRHRRAIEDASAALPVAEAAKAATARSRALNALGTSLMNLGHVDEGAGYLREALDLAASNHRYRERISACLNLAEALHQAGRSTEARAIAEEGLAWVAQEGGSAPWLELLDAEIAYDLGEWDYAAEHMPASCRDSGTGYLNEILRRAELSLGRGEEDGARALLAEADEASRDLQEPQFIGVLGALGAELARRGGDLDAARVAVQGALDRIETCTDDVVRLARVATIGSCVEADAAQRARDVGDETAERHATLEGEFHLARVQAAAENGGPVEAAHLKTAEAEHARALGRPDADAYEAAAAAWEAVQRPYSAALMRWRAADTLLAAGERDAAGEPLTRARETAARLRAGWLLGEIDGLAARARVTVEGGGPPTPETPEPVEDPFGLTPRERQVLALVAEGRTNREIGDTLFMAEKTASVHVSRILGKLDVRSRTEAAAVAHRLGLDGAVAGQAG